MIKETLYSVLLTNWNR